MFIDLNTGNNLGNCTVENNACIAKCQCNKNYGGIDCSLLSEDISLLSRKQSHVLLQLINSISTPTLEPTRNPTVLLGHPTFQPSLKPTYNETRLAEIKEKSRKQLLDSIGLTIEVLSVGLPMNENNIELSANLITNIMESGVENGISLEEVSDFTSVVSDIMSVTIEQPEAVQSVEKLYNNYIESFAQLAMNSKYLFNFILI